MNYSHHKFLRVSVVGTSCSGKSTFARRLARALHLAQIELDALHWQADWQARPPAEFRALVAEAAARERWVIDGNYGQVRELVWGRATHVIWLNYPFPLVCARALGRTIRRVVRREELFAGNRETWRQSFFSRDSILWWVVTTYHRRRRQYRALFSRTDPAGPALIELRNQRQADAFMRSLTVN